ncbi:MAG: endolytic transglycosylase MltG [Elusimicrobia bacterium]|nr:endolytic transglycosylase MltG [Elusimicrobiota bacterium]
MIRTIFFIVLFLLLLLTTQIPVKTEVHIPSRSNAFRIASFLQKKGILKRKNLFLLTVNFFHLDKKLKFGDYRMYLNQPIYSLINLLKKGSNFLIKVTIPEGFRAEQIAQCLSDAGIVEREEFLEYVKKNKLEGYLFPETYFFSRNMKVEDVAKAFLKQFNRVFTEDLKRKAKEHNLTPHQAVILASIIEREAKTKEEKFLISGIFHNRLKKKWRLESCATVRYALKKWKAPLSIEDTYVKSPFNTYRHFGLPPAPISNPGADSLIAAVSPKKTALMFFVVSSSGTHKFSRYFKDHIRAKWMRKRKK